MNQQKSLTQLIVENYKYIFVLVLTSQVFTLLTGNIDYNNPIYANSDFNKYLEMAKASPSLADNVIRPFVFRIIIPWLAGVMPFSIQINFQILNHISLFFLSSSVFLFFIDNAIPSKLALFLTILFQLNRYFFLFNTWNYFQVADLISLGILFLAFVLLKRKKWLIMLVVFPFSVLIKEYILFFLPAGFIYLFENKHPKGDLGKFALISIFSMLIFILIREIIFTEKGLSLLVQYKIEGLFYLQPFYLIKRFIVPFTPFGLIPIFHFKRTFIFFKKRLYFLVFISTVIVLSFLGEPERLMAPISVVYFLYIGTIAQEILKNLYIKRFQLYFLLILLVISFVASFYHLWGIVILPNKDLTMIITILTNMLTLFVFLFTKNFYKNNVKNKVKF